MHLDLKIHTGGNMLLGVGSISIIPKWQKIKTNSFTEADLVGVDDFLHGLLWTIYFIEAKVVCVCLFYPKCKASYCSMTGYITIVEIFLMV